MALKPLQYRPLCFNIAPRLSDSDDIWNDDEDDDDDDKDDDNNADDL